MRLNQSMICNWTESTFGSAADLALARANEELAEGLRAITAGKPFEDVAEKVADVAIVLCRAASLAHIELRRVEDSRRTGPATTWMALHLFHQVGRELLDAIEHAEDPAEFGTRFHIRAAYAGLGDLARQLGFGLWDRIDARMAINCERVWRQDGTGRGYHVREKVPA
jgi:NTP pyrophosphatase (non-canonical NTP hydrolase)